MQSVLISDGTSLAGLILSLAALITAMAAYRRAGGKDKDDDE